jgi:hypothetical protein
MFEPAIYALKIESPTVPDFEAWQLTGFGQSIDGPRMQAQIL